MRFVPQKDGLLVLAPAKLNLALYVLERRSDGYHIIRTLMTPITLFDRLLFRFAAKDELVVEGIPSLRGERNTITRAISAFKQHFGAEVPPLFIRLEKRIPAGSGLGGGSSDAAATILALHHLLGVPQDTKKDIACALDVGSDVPFFLRCQPCWMGGIGDVFEKDVEIGHRAYTLVVPDFICHTKSVYSAIQLTCASVSGKIYNGLGDDAAMDEVFFNDLEDAAARVYPPIGDLIRVLHPLGFRMTGSGSAFFGPPRSDWLCHPPRFLTRARIFLVETCAGVKWF